jgi:hypothetical protein
LLTQQIPKSLKVKDEENVEDDTPDLIVKDEHADGVDILLNGWDP